MGSPWFHDDRRPGSCHRHFIGMLIGTNMHGSTLSEYHAHKILHPHASNALGTICIPIQTSMIKLPIIQLIWSMNAQAGEGPDYQLLVCMACLSLHAGIQ